MAVVWPCFLESQWQVELDFNEPSVRNDRSTTLLIGMDFGVHEVLPRDVVEQ